MSVTLEPDTSGVDSGLVVCVVSQCGDITVKVNSAVGDVVCECVCWSSCCTTNNVNTLEVHEGLLSVAAVGAIGASAVAVAGAVAANEPTNRREPSVDLGSSCSSHIVVALNIPENTKALRYFSNTQGSNEAIANCGVFVPWVDDELLRSASLEVESTS